MTINDTNLDPIHNQLDTMLLDKQIFTLRVVGRKHLTAYQLWLRWVNQ